MLNRKLLIYIAILFLGVFVGGTSMVYAQSIEFGPVFYRIPIRVNPGPTGVAGADINVSATAGEITCVPVPEFAADLSVLCRTPRAFSLGFADYNKLTEAGDDRLLIGWVELETFGPSDLTIEIGTFTDDGGGLIPPTSRTWNLPGP